MPPQSDLKHLVIPPSAQGVDFAPVTGFDRNATRPILTARQQRYLHATKLENDLSAAVDARASALQAIEGLDGSLVSGVSLEIEGAAVNQLEADKLENRQSNYPIELLNVKIDGDHVSATIFVPQSRFEFLKRRIKKYGDPAEDSDGTKGSTILIDSVEAIKLADLASFWIPDIPLPTDLTQIVTWEVWLRKGSHAVVKQNATKFGIVISGHKISFQECEICLITGSQEKLALLQLALMPLVGLAYREEMPDFFEGLTPAEQTEWMDSLLPRIRHADINAPAVCILDTGVHATHPLLRPAIADTDRDACNPAWGKEDHSGHGTKVAGIALFEDLSPLLAGAGSVELKHRLESVKILPPRGTNPEEHYGWITQEAVSRSQINAPSRGRVFCLAVTAAGTSTNGRPSAWSSSIDKICFGLDDELNINNANKQLFVISAGNIGDNLSPESYPDLNMVECIENPGQSWNALTIGAITHKSFPNDPSVSGWSLLGVPGGLPVSAVRHEVTRTERILRALAEGDERARRAYLSYESHALPIMENASALTSAKIDLLPHQVVLTHRVATASPRRYLIADEVGLGKTIETALILRELASRGELKRALMVVPAGLVNNWHRELNEVFNLGFEVFGSEGDITDRKTNAFAKHDRLIASIDTLKRPARIKRILEADRWDLVVFDEAHHLTAYRVGGKIRKTENYKLAEALKDHSRDLLLLSATPHQGNHFQFWMLIQLLNSTLFGSPEEMVENRHRLNTVMFRRTKADACQPDGSSLFARRWVHTESFLMNQEEKIFYEKLREYLEDGFDLARRQGSKGQALGFLMAIFQKIAASSFAAVRRTLKRRLLMLTLHEALLRDKDLDIDGRERLLDEARDLVHEEFSFPRDSVGRSEVDRMLADLKYRLAKKLDEDSLELACDPYASEYSAANAEEAASTIVDIHLPEERLRISDLLAIFPHLRETKAQKLIDGLGHLWRQNAQEKIVIFATYLGTVELIAKEIELAYPGQGVVVLRGGDHGAKLAAERRFRQKDGPRVLVCTAAGREGINLQFARILFNFDLPWNPMDIEQRIGRIHRYGQNHTAQIYNLVLSDTIEGRIYLLLDEKLTEIARAVGKVDDQGNVAEDLRAQILGQLSERLNYDRLYQEAISDPELKRTQVELEAALSNSREARQVVFDLFQDLDGFSLDDYKPFSDVSSSISRLVRFFSSAVAERQQKLVKADDETYDLMSVNSERFSRFTINRDVAADHSDWELIGIDHALVQRELDLWRGLSPEEIGISVSGEVDALVLLSIWMVEVSSGNGERRIIVQPIAVRQDGTRVPFAEKQFDQYFHSQSMRPKLTPEQRINLFSSAIEPTLQRELKHKGVSCGDESYSAELIGCVEIVNSKE